MRFIEYGLRACPADDGAGSAPLARRQTGAAGRKWRWGSRPTARETFNEDGFITTRDNPATPENDVEIMQENHYYPFGMNHDGRWFGPQDPENRYTYNGKEYNPELGLDWYDYGARWYDAALGRWGQVDPLAEMMSDKSGYSYALNNPILFIDAVGMFPGGAEAWESHASADIKYDWFSGTYRDRNGRETAPPNLNNANGQNQTINSYIYNDSGGRLSPEGLLEATIYAAQIFAKNGFDNFKFIFLDSKANSSIALNWYDLYLAIRYTASETSGGKVTSDDGIPSKSINHININFYGLDGKRNFLYGVGYLMAHEMLHSILHQTSYHFTKIRASYHTYETAGMTPKSEKLTYPAHFNDYPNLNMDAAKLMNQHGGIPLYPSGQLHAAERITFDHRWWILVLSKAKR